MDWLIDWLSDWVSECHNRKSINLFYFSDGEPASFSATSETGGGVSASSLAARLTKEQAHPSEHVRITRVPSRSDDDDDVDESEMTPEELAKRWEFKEHRKKHYNEFQMAQKARELLQKEEVEDLSDVPMAGSAIVWGRQRSFWLIDRLIDWLIDWLGHVLDALSSFTWWGFDCVLRIVCEQTEWMHCMVYVITFSVFQRHASFTFLGHDCHYLFSLDWASDLLSASRSYRACLRFGLSGMIIYKILPCPMIFANHFSVARPSCHSINSGFIIFFLVSSIRW